ncbi:MAG: glycosyltransferase family 2 protein [Arachidicoccus sp.]|nr:glycosyltransferase family 2 protein [Arachidicoccus sp.]
MSIIIINYKTRDLTLQCIQSIYDYTKNVSFEIILVDNASEDDTIEKVNEKFPEVITIANTENIGFGRANNQGIRIAKGEFVFLLNSDAYLMNNAISDFVNFLRLEINQSVAICGGDLFYDNTCKQRMASFGNLPTLKEEVFILSGLFKLFKNYFRKHISAAIINYDNKIKDVGFIIGADMFIRKAVLEKIGLFDEDFFMYFEETELSFRAKAAGYKSVIIPSIKLCHLDGGSSKKNNDLFNYKKFTYFEKSKTLYFKKCYGHLSSTISKILSSLLVIELSILAKKQGSPLKKIGIIIKA